MKPTEFCATAASLRVARGMRAWPARSPICGPTGISGRCPPRPGRSCVISQPSPKSRDGTHSRGFDRLIDGFRYLNDGRQGSHETDGCRLILAGPDPGTRRGRPRGEAGARHACRQMGRLWTRLSRAKVMIINLPLSDPRRNALIVNALQRHSTVVAQMSRREGFGLTATEAMWKGKPILATAGTGVAFQVRQGREGLLLDPDAPPEDASGCHGTVARRRGAPGTIGCGGPGQSGGEVSCRQSDVPVGGSAPRHLHREGAPTGPTIGRLTPPLPATGPSVVRPLCAAFSAGARLDSRHLLFRRQASCRLGPPTGSAVRAAGDAMVGSRRRVEPALRKRWRFWH